MGSPGIIHDCTPHCHIASWHGCMDNLKTERNFDLQATWVNDVLGLLFRHVIHWCLRNQTLADVRWTGAGIKCLYCRTKVCMMHLQSSRKYCLSLEYQCLTACFHTLCLVIFTVSIVFQCIAHIGGQFITDCCCCGSWCCCCCCCCFSCWLCFST